MNLLIKFIVFLFFSLQLIDLSFAQNNNGVKPLKKQSINFEDELIEGNAQKPELFYLFQKKNFNYTKLIKLRENFLPEMRKTSEDIQRVRGGR